MDGVREPWRLHTTFDEEVDMNGLLDLITRTKGIEYLLALAFLFTFVAFWQWHEHKGRGLVKSAAPLAILGLVFAGLATAVITSPATATQDARKWPSVDQAHYLANIYGPAKFAAHDMGPDIISCQTCHHHSKNGQPGPCSECHTQPSNGEKPGLKAAYHQRCADCHVQAFSGPMTCTNCHTERPEVTEFKKKHPFPAVAPSIRHELTDGFSDCFSCHRAEGPLPLPGNHSFYKANVVCLGCHKPSSKSESAALIKEISTKVPPTPTAKPAAQAAPQPAPAAPKTAAASAITHGVAGKENCTMCHQPGGGMKAMPADHAGRTNSTCQACHQAA